MLRTKVNWKKTMTGLSALLLLMLILFFLLIYPRDLTLAQQLPKTLSLQYKQHKVHYENIHNINKYIQEAAISSQDKRFYTNQGIDVISTMRALLMTIVTGKRQGASTIPEQLVKNAYYHDKDTLITDIETKILAPFVIARYSKASILEMYLNDIYYGKNAYGIFNASNIYFHTTPKNVSLAQSAYLLGLINAPSYFGDHQKSAIEEAILVLGEMKRDHYISNSQMTAAETTLKKM